MKHILFILLTLLAFTSYSQDTKTIDFSHNSLDDTIASKFLSLIKTNLGCCEESDLKKQKSYQIIVYFTTDPYYMGGYFDLYHYYELLQEDTYADSIADEDKHLHNHPWDFKSVVLKGAYIEKTEKGIIRQTPGKFNSRNGNDFHKILRLVTPVVYTLFIVTPTEEQL